MAATEEDDESFIARTIAQLRIAERCEELDEEDRVAARSAREKLEGEADWSEAQYRLAAMTGRPPEAFDASEYEIPDIEDLEMVRRGEIDCSCGCRDGGESDGI